MLPPPPPDLLAHASLLLDFDGTLVDLAPTPDAVVVDERLRALLARAAATLDGRVAIISGRSIAQIEGFLGDALAVSGSHGLEVRFADGRVRTPERPPALDEALRQFHAFAAQWPGTLVEDKPFGAALHWRRAPSAAVQGEALAAALADETGLHLQPGKMMAELRLGGADKGEALRAFMAEGPMAGTRPVFLGDDVTDEPAMAAAAALGGAGVLVGPERATSARYRLPDVAAVLDWLDGALTPT
jgi:trehalose 6-phosphate phosphatase